MLKLPNDRGLSAGRLVRLPLGFDFAVLPKCCGQLVCCPQIIRKGVDQQGIGVDSCACVLARSHVQAALDLGGPENDRDSNIYVFTPLRVGWPPTPDVFFLSVTGAKSF